MAEQGALGLAVEGGFAGGEHGDEDDQHEPDGGRDPQRAVTTADGGFDGDRHTPTGSWTRGSGNGADTGSGGRRRRPGHAASSVPMAMTPPPIQSHPIKGCTTTPMTAGSRGDAGAARSGRDTSSVNPVRTDGEPMAWVANGN